MKLRPFPDDEQLPDGVYLNLPESRYFAQRCLGSTDLAGLWLRQEGWWWRSPNNPFWKRMESSPQAYGTALHTLVLEGDDVFAKRYARAPDKRDYPGLLETIDDIKYQLEVAGAPAVNRRMTKAQLLEYAKVYLGERPIWDLIWEDAERRAGDRILLGAQDWWELHLMRDAALKDETARVIVQAAGGVRLVEVSVFWTLPDGVRLRFRFDSLLPSVNADLKSIDNYRDDDLAEAIGKRIGGDALDIQAALSFTARRMLYAYVEAGAVYAQDPERDAKQGAYLARFPTEAPLDLGERPGWFWLWMFYQKADEKGRAPVIFPLRMDFGGGDHLDGARKALHALDFYRRKVAEVGLQEPWTRVEPLHHLDPVQEKRVSIPHWIKRPMAITGDSEEIQWQD